MTVIDDLVTRRLLPLWVSSTESNCSLQTVTVTPHSLPSLPSHTVVSRWVDGTEEQIFVIEEFEH